MHTNAKQGLFNDIPVRDHFLNLVNASFNPSLKGFRTMIVSIVSKIPSLDCRFEPLCNYQTIYLYPML